MKAKMVSLYNRQPLLILDAGCGRHWPFGFDDIPYKLTGIDFDKAALDIRTDLHESICGDLCTIDIPPNSFDAIYNSFVLEHVNGAETMLLNFVRWIKPGGAILLHMPDRQTVAAWIIRMMPHKLKVFIRKIMGYKNSGKPGYPPYPTVYEPIVSREGMYRFCKRNGLSIEAEFFHTFYTNRWWMRTIARIINVLSLGSLLWKHEALSYIIVKNQ